MYMLGKVTSSIRLVEVRYSQGPNEMCHEPSSSSCALFRILVSNHQCVGQCPPRSPMAISGYL